MQGVNCCALLTNPSGAIRKPIPAPPRFTAYRFAHRSCRVELPAGSDVPMPASSYALARRADLAAVRGSWSFREGDTRHEMQAGDCLELRPPNDCRFINETNRPCVYLLVRLNQSGS